MIEFQTRFVHYKGSGLIELQAKLGKLKRKQQQCGWYKQTKKRTKESAVHMPSDASDAESNTRQLSSPSVNSSISTTPTSLSVLQPPTNIPSFDLEKPLSRTELQASSEQGKHLPSTPRSIADRDVVEVFSTKIDSS